MTDGSEVGSVRTIEGVAGGPLAGKFLTETCTCNKDGHSYAHNYTAPFGSDGYPFEMEHENFQGTFAVDAIDATHSILSYCGHFFSSDVDGTKATLDGLLVPVGIEYCCCAQDHCRL